jgi:hypothetical protein
MTDQKLDWIERKIDLMFKIFINKSSRRDFGADVWYPYYHLEDYIDELMELYNFSKEDILIDGKMPKDDTDWFNALKNLEQFRLLTDK